MQSMPSTLQISSKVLDGAAGLDEDGAHGLAATLGEVVEQVHGPSGVADEWAEPASPLRRVAGSARRTQPQTRRW